MLVELHRAGRRYGASLALAVVALLAFVVPGAGEWLQLDRERLGGGQFWLLLTGHFAHWSADHLVWDLVAFIALAAFAESRSRGRMLGCVAVSGLVISIAFLLFERDLDFYRGLSGIDSALFALALMEMFHLGGKDGDWRLKGVAVIGLVAFVAKIGFELVTGSAAFVEDSGFVALPSAHLAGFISGVAVSIASRLSLGRAGSRRPLLETAPTNG